MRFKGGAATRHAQEEEEEDGFTMVPSDVYPAPEVSAMMHDSSTSMELESACVSHTSPSPSPPFSPSLAFADRRTTRVSDNVNEDAERASLYKAWQPLQCPHCSHSLELPDATKIMGNTPKLEVNSLPSIL